MNATAATAAIDAAIARAQRHSPFLRVQTEKFPEVVSKLRDGLVNEAFEAARRTGEGEEILASVRRERSAHALLVGLLDLAGCWSLEQVTASLSELADRALDRALGAAFLERGAREVQGFTVIGLGKLGGRELNYSSDVDLLLLFDPASLPRKNREEPGQAALRLGQRLVELMQKRTEDGYAFRVDLRLRPSSEVTPIVLPVDAALGYYEASALPWERAAFIRSRVVAGDRRLGSYFLQSLHPFVWRRSLDFGAIGEIQSITRRIRDHYAQGQAFGPGYDVKRGRGGIREIEFFAQIHQLIHGGRDPALRAAATVEALEALERAGHVSADDRDDLVAAYRVLRTVEHRLQMVDDRQTHMIPRQQGDLDQVGHLAGRTDGAHLLLEIQPHVQKVARRYDRLVQTGERHFPHDGEAIDQALREMGFADPPAARARIVSWRSGRIRSLRTGAASEAFEAMLPALLEAFSRAPDGLAAMTRFENLIERLPSGVNFFRLLDARPALAEHLSAILSHAPALAEQLGRRPELLDGLIDASAFDPAPPVDELVGEFARPDRAAEDYQLLLDRVRRKVNERRFALGVQLVTGQGDPLEVAQGNSRVAEAAISVLTRATIAEFERSYGKVEGSELLILGLGRLGGEELTFASDLDLVFLFTGTHEAESQGPRPLRATEYFNRLAQRVTAALSVPTAVGPLYDVDTRLRPNGRNGLLAVSVESFARYQQEQAWTWEHLALLRARPLFGTIEARVGLRRVLDDVFHLPREAGVVTGDAARMRREIALHKPPDGPLDIKHGPGGLIDLEFAVQTLQLREGVGVDPHLDTALAALVEKGLVDSEIRPALRLLTRMLVMFRLVAPATREPAEATRPLVARACGYESWEELLAAHAEARQRIAALWRSVTEANGG